MWKNLSLKDLQVVTTYIAYIKDLSVICVDLKDLYHIFKEDLQKVEDFIVNQTRISSVPIISSIMTYFFKEKGKQIRPLFMFLLSNHDSLYQAAAAIELIHTASLLHDDVIDKSPLRRGQKSVHQHWSSPVSILMGDFLFSKAFEIFVTMKNLDILTIITKTAQDLSKGELLQLSEGRDQNFSKERYIDMITMKTGSIFEAAFGVSSLLSKGCVDTMRNAGKNFGIAFQIIDDILDYTTRRKQDFLEGKITLPLILLRKTGEEISQNFDDLMIQLKSIFPDCYLLAEFFLEKACDSFPADSKVSCFMKALINRN